jgi:AcrR family transcriptional regulator
MDSPSLTTHPPRHDARPESAAGRLVHAAARELETHGPESISIERILENSNTNFQVLFREFGGLDGLLDAARLAQVTMRTRLSIEMIRSALNSVATYEDVFTQVLMITAAVHDGAYRENRLIRSAVIGSTLHRPELRDALAEMQNELTNGIASHLQSAVDRGLFRCAVSPRAVAVFIQAYTAGQIVDEIDHTPTPLDEWLTTVDLALRGLILPPLTSQPQGRPQ